MPIRLCALMSFGVSFRISRNSAMPGSICCCRINDRACSYEAGGAGDCATAENSSASSDATMKHVLKKSDLTGSRYLKQGKRGTHGNNGTRGSVRKISVFLPRVLLFPRVAAFSLRVFRYFRALRRFQNSIFNPNWAFLAPKARVDLPKSGLDVSPTGRSRFTRLKRLKNSARKRRLAPSLPRNQGILVFFASMKSVLA